MGKVGWSGCSSPLCMEDGEEKGGGGGLEKVQRILGLERPKREKRDNDNFPLATKAFPLTSRFQWHQKLDYAKNK